MECLSGKEKRKWKRKKRPWVTSDVIISSGKLHNENDYY